MIQQKRKIHKPKNRTIGHIYGGWIKYQLALINVSQTDIAEKFGVRDTSVWAVIHGRRTSARIQQAIADALGLPDWQTVLAAAKRAVKGNVV